MGDGILVQTGLVIEGRTDSHWDTVRFTNKLCKVFGTSNY